MPDTMLENFDDLLKKIEAKRLFHEQAAKECSAALELHGAALSEARTVEDSLKVAKNVYLNSSALNSGEKSFTAPAIDQNKVANERRSLRADGRTRDIFEVLSMFPDGIPRESIRHYSGYEPKPVGTTLDRMMNDGYIDRKDKYYFLTAEGRELLAKSSPYKGTLHITPLSNHKGNEIAATAPSLGSDAVAAEFN